MKIVKYCNAFEAEVIRGRLESEGIPAAVLNELANLVFPNALGAPSAAAVQVAVADEDYEKALAILGESE